MKHFRLEELVDKNTFATQGDAAWQLFDTHALMMLDDLREFFGVPLIINNWLWMKNGYQFRGYRPPDCKVGAPNSYHKRGMAFDFDVKGMSAENARKMILTLGGPLVAMVKRLEGGVNWVHADTGERPKNYAGIYVFSA